MTGYYFAATFGRHAEMRDYRDQIEGVWPGQVRVTSRWIDLHNGDQLEATTAEELNNETSDAGRYADNDIEDMTNSDVFVLFTGDGPSLRGGRHTEFGRAQHEYEQFGAPRLVIVGPRENVFHRRPGVEVHSDWRAFLRAEKRRYLLPGETRASRRAAVVISDHHGVQIGNGNVQTNRF